MPKKVVKYIKLQIVGGAATAAPPVGTALGPAGVNIGEFVKQFNEQTRPMAGTILPVLLSVYADRTFSFIVKKPPASRLILKVLGKDKGSSKPLSSKVGKLTKAQLREIATEKMENMNASSVEQAMNTIAGTARSMGVDVEK